MKRQTSMRRAAVFLNGFYDRRYPDFYRAAMRREETLLVCADGGLRVWSWLEDVPPPHVVVGDFDSIGAAERRCWEERGVQFLPGPSDVTPEEAKEVYLDGELALLVALESGVSDVTLHGALPYPEGYDHEHFIGNLFLLYGSERSKSGTTVAIRIEEPRESIVLCRKSVTLLRRGEKLNRVSLVPLAGPARAARSEGLRWPLDGLTLETTRPNALRNEFLPDADRAVIELETGSAPVFVFHNW